MLRIENLNKSFNIGTDFENNIFSNFNLTLENNSSTAIIGSNGCGKSTLLNLIAGSLTIDSGSIIIDADDISNLKEQRRSQYFGRVYQDPFKGVASSLTILENMALADKKNEYFGLRKLIKKNKIEYYVELLKTLDLGLENHLNTKVNLLSGGQRQSLSLLMATMKYPKLLLLDEHTAALDPKTSNVVMEKTVELIESNDITTLMITHNMEDAVNYSDRVIMLDEGRIVLDEKSSNINANDLNNIYKEKINNFQLVI